MASDVTTVRVFIASPQGLDEVRAAFAHAVWHFSGLLGDVCGVRFDPIVALDRQPAPSDVAAPIVGRASDCHFAVLVFDEAWGAGIDLGDGTPRPAAEAYELAKAWRADPAVPMRRLVAFFRGIDPQLMANPGPGLQEALAVRARIEAEQACVFHTFDDLDAAAEWLRLLLVAWLDAARTPAAPDQAVSPGGPLVFGSRDLDVPTLPPSAPDAPDAPLLARAEALAAQEKLTEAERAYAEALALGPSLLALQEYATFLHRAGRVGMAEVTAERGLDQAQRSGDEAAMVPFLDRLGQISGRQDDGARSEMLHRQALETSERSGRPEWTAIQCARLGSLHFARGDFELAEALFRKALEIQEHLGSQEWVAICCGNVGAACQARGALEEAEPMHRRALEIAERLGRPEIVAAQCTLLASLHLARADPVQAEAMVRKALEPDGSSVTVAERYWCLGCLLNGRGELVEAEAVLRKGLAINERVGRLKGMRSCCMTLGAVCEGRGDRDAALAAYRKAQACGERLPDAPDAAPFRQAVEEALARLTAALSPRPVRAGPTVYLAMVVTVLGALTVAVAAVIVHPPSAGAAQEAVANRLLWIAGAMVLPAVAFLLAWSLRHRR